MSGSSPLTRGKPRQNRGRSLVPGLIPAHAGKTPALPRLQRPGEAHPRSRGENFRMGGGGHFRSGSSPLTRGKLDLVRTQVRTIGLIPAHAGKTEQRSALAYASAAHPRSRGENASSSWSARSLSGSSPLTRGKLSHGWWGAFSLRLIPAHAGKTDRAAPFWELHGAHPRSRGENGPWTDPGPRLGGSSPLTRGKRELSRDRLASWRLIPAHAGKTQRARRRHQRLRAHPRSRGENSEDVWRDADVAGSSPLTRGKLPVRDRPPRGRRLIPAHAGKTSAARSGRDVEWAHPRSRGENASVSAVTCDSMGSSPLTRGKRGPPGRW